jgi:hypothetical protein
MAKFPHEEFDLAFAAQEFDFCLNIADILCAYGYEKKAEALFELKRYREAFQNSDRSIVLFEGGGAKSMLAKARLSNALLVQACTMFELGEDPVVARYILELAVEKDAMIMIADNYVAYSGRISKSARLALEAKRMHIAIDQDGTVSAL